jgi:hypothetical protein
MPRGKRKDLGCPFGCSEAHRGQESTRRSAAYYRTKEGRKKKRDLNQRRPAACRSPAPAPAAIPKNAPDPAGSGPWPEPLVDHVRLVVSWIERRPVRRAEILQLMTKVLRQQGMGRRRRIDHTVAWLHEHPP